MTSRAARRPATTPMVPSYFPALRTISLCEPQTRVPAPGVAQGEVADEIAGLVFKDLQPDFMHPFREAGI